MTFGAFPAGVLATVASTSEQSASDWHRAWFLVLFCAFTLLALSGLYIVLAGVFHRLPPVRWTAHVQPPQAAPGPSPRPFLSFTDDEFADRFWQASWNVQRMLRKRWDEAPNHPPGSTPRNYFGPDEYARETVRIYTAEHSEEIEALFSEAVRRGHAPRGRYGVVAANAHTVDDVWCLVYRAGWIFTPLKSGTATLPTTKPEWIERHIEQGIDYRDTLRKHDARGYEQRRNITPYQQFALWWFDLQDILRPEYDHEWHELPLPPPDLASPGDPQQLADLIDAALEQLNAAREKMGAA